MCVCELLLPWKISKYYIFVCVSVRAGARLCVAFLIQYAYAPCCDVICGSITFSALCHKRHVFRKKTTEHEMCVLIFSTIFIWKISHSKKKSTRYWHKCENVFMLSTLYSCKIIMKLKFSLQIFEKRLNVKIHQNSSSWNRIFPCGQTDGHEANSRSWQFSERT
jgi:hypothetical protein